MDECFFPEKFFLCFFFALFLYWDINLYCVRWFIMKIIKCDPDVTNEIKQFHIHSKRRSSIDFQVLRFIWIESSRQTKKFERKSLNAIAFEVYSISLMDSFVNLQYQKHASAVMSIERFDINPLSWKWLWKCLHLMQTNEKKETTKIA